MSKPRSSRPLVALVARALLEFRSSPIIVVAVALLTAGWAFARVSSRAAPLPFFAAGDTAVVWGPDTMRTNNGNRVTYVEATEITTQAGRQYAMRMQRIGTGSLTQGTVTVNHHEVATKNDFPTTGTTVTLPLKLIGADTLVVEVNGGVSDGLVVSILSSTDATVQLYAKTYTKTSGSTFDTTATFTKPTTVGPPAYIYVNAVPPTGYNKASADIYLNGAHIVTDSPNDLSLQVTSLATPVALLAGTNTIRVVEHGTDPARFSLEIRATTTVPPVLTITTPAPNAITKNTSIAVTGTVTDATSVTVTVNGVAATFGGGNSYSATAPLPNEGSNTITIHAVNAAGLSTDSTRTVKRDTQAPTLIVTAPADGLLTNGDSVTVTGTVADANAVTVTVNGVPVTLSLGAFSTKVGLSEGPNFVMVVATDAATNSSSITRQVNRDRTPPLLTVTSPANGATTSDATIAVTGTAQDASAVTVTVNGSPVTVTSGAFSTTMSLQTGSNTITVVATDAATNSTTVIRTVTRTGGGGFTPTPMTEILGADSSIGAPALSTTTASPTPLATAFLYSGPNPIQVGVQAGAIDSVRAGALRGRVVDRAGQPLPGVNVSIVGSTGLGHTTTRANGLWDMAVNGGGDVIVRFTRTGFPAVQRRARLAWQRVEALDDVVMTPLSATVSAINFSQPIQIARGPVESDASGPRQVTMLFKQGTAATVVLPNGTTQAAGTLHVRATEFTVGTLGPKAMPAELPPLSAYTFAVDLSADEAIAVDGSLRFSQPVPVYADNFLGFPVGATVPVGTYDALTARWVPQQNGVVIKILSTSGGTATIDADGDGVAEPQAVLDSLHINSAELSALATLYAAGKTLWRWEADHFSPQDFNWAVPRPPPDAMSPFGPSQEPRPTHPTECPGCSLGLEGQTLGEQIGLQGTPFSLVYASDRTRTGARHGNIIRIPVTGETIGPNSQGVTVTIDIAGRIFERVLALVPNQTIEFEWDGKDAYGRTVPSAVAKVTRALFVSVPYIIPASIRGFGGPCTPDPVTSTCLAAGVPARVAESVRDLRFLPLDKPDNAAAALGGWSLDAHHTFDAVSRSVRLGDGHTLAASRIVTPGMVRIAGNDTAPTVGGDGGPARSASFARLGDLAAAVDGTLYIADADGHVVRRIGRDGIITRVAGTGSAGNGVPGGPGTATAINSPGGLAVGPDGTVYISDTGNNRVLALRHDTLTLVAGGNGQGGAGDGGLATAAELFQPTRLAVSRNRTVLIVDVGNHDVREVGADAIIRRFAGGGSACFVDSIAATAAGCLDPTSVAVLPNGAVAIGTSNSVKVVDVGGTITTIAGLATLGTCDNHDSQVGVPALDAGVCPSGITAGADGSLYLAELDGQLFRRISPDGTLTQVRFCLPQFDGVALRAPTRIPVANQMFINGQCQHMTAGPDGALYVAGNGTIDKLDQVLPQYLNAAFRVASEDGAELYDFDGAGRHLRTLDALTNATLLTFGYDAQGRLTSIADADNNVTTFQRNGAGLATAIVSPYGETTTLTMDGQGRLTQVANPAGERMTLGYNADGILSTVTDPRQKLTRFTYDSLGRLTKEENPIGGSLTLARTVNDVADTVAVTDALARARRVSTTRGDNAVTVRTGTDAAGQRTTSTERADASTTTATPDQTLVTQFTVEDPRFGGQSRLTTQSTVRLPSNNTATVYFGRTVQLANPSDPSTLVRQTDTLVVAGQTFRGVYDATTRTFTATSPEGRTSSLVLDAKGRVMQVATAGLAPINYAYDTHGRLASISQGDRTETYTYNTQGRRATVIDPLSRVTSFSYDAAGHVISEALPGSRAVSFAYDSAGNLTSLTPPGKPAHTFSYSGANLPTAYQAPVVSGSTGTTSYSYSVQKELLSLTRPDSQVVGIGYDATGRPASVTSAEGTHTIGYHPSTGQVTSLVAPQGISQALRYDGALPTGTTWSGAVAGAVDFTYDNAFRLAGIQVNGDGVSDASYDRDGLPVTIGFLSLFYRSDNGLLERLFGAGYDSRWTYDSLAQVTTYAVVNQFSPTDTVFRAGYTYDRLGRITAIRERIQADTATYGFAYDNAGRLATVQKSGVTVAGYTYDLNGNRTQTVYPSQSLAGTYDNQDRLLSYGSNSYAYTGNGELTRKMSGTDTTRYRYDALGNLRDVYLPNGDHIEYVIDVQQRRIWRKLNGTLQKGWLYQNQLGIAAELGGSGNVTKTFQYGTHANVPDRMQFNGNGYRLVTDHLGSVRLVLDQSTGQVMQRLDYDAYGRVTQNTNPGFQPFGYAGGLLDDATGLVRFGARDYDPETGRWTAKEPLGIVAGGTNPYRYSDNSPVSLQDDNGFLPCCTASESRQIAQEISARLRPWQPVLEGVATAEMVLLGGFEAEGAAAVRAAARGYGSYRGLSRLSARACRELDFVAGADGSVFPVPRGAAGPAPTRSPGFQFTGGTGGHGLDSRVTGVRFMEANSNQGSRAVYMNASGQTVNPFTGQTVASSDPLAHFYFNLFAR